jgi:hypothetical protein
MPTIPKIITKTNVSVDVLNAIRNASSQNYKDYVPVATPNAEVIRKIGAVLVDSPNLANEFISTLVNRIARVYISSRSYQNPWSFFKKGVLEYGETIEEIFVNIAKPYTFDQQEAEQKVFAREIPDVKSAFHVMNYQKFYKVTISEDQLRQAFLSLEGVTDLIAKITETLVTSMNYDEFLTMKYMLARRLLDGLMYTEKIDPVSTANMKSIISTIKGVSNDMTFLSPKYNLMGVYNHTTKERQYIIVNSKFDATMDVEVLASAFNMDRAEFFGHRVLIDSFATLDNARLAELFKDDNTYEEITHDELLALDTIPAILVDEDFFQIYDNLLKFTDNYNGQGLYWNYWYHAWKTFSVSPFANNVAFISTEQTVDSVDVNPKIATMSVGDSAIFTAKVTGSAFVDKGVVWSINSDKATVDTNGKVTILDGATGEITVTATSKADSSKLANATITVA